MKLDTSKHFSVVAKRVDINDSEKEAIISANKQDRKVDSPIGNPPWF